jgi:hypothetical protein
VHDHFCCVPSQLAVARDPDAAIFKRLEGLQPCEMSALKAGTHIFAVYGECCFCPLNLKCLSVVLKIA